MWTETAKSIFRAVAKQAKGQTPSGVEKKSDTLEASLELLGINLEIGPASGGRVGIAHTIKDSLQGETCEAVGKAGIIAGNAVGGGLCAGLGMTMSVATSPYLTPGGGALIGSATTMLCSDVAGKIGKELAQDGCQLVDDTLSNPNSAFVKPGGLVSPKIM